MDEETLLLEVETAMEEAVEHMQAGFAGVRTGKASPSLVDNMDIYVASYGTSMKLKSIAVVPPQSEDAIYTDYDALYKKVASNTSKSAEAKKRAEKRLEKWMKYVER